MEVARDLPRQAVSSPSTRLCSATATFTDLGHRHRYQIIGKVHSHFCDVQQHIFPLLRSLLTKNHPLQRDPAILPPSSMLAYPTGDWGHNASPMCRDQRSIWKWRDLLRELGGEPLLVCKGNIHSRGKCQIFHVRRNGSDLHYNWSSQTNLLIQFI